MFIFKLLLNWASLSAGPFLTCFTSFTNFTIFWMSVLSTMRHIIFHVWGFLFLLKIIRSSHISKFSICFIICRGHWLVVSRISFNDWVQLCLHIDLIDGTSFLMKCLFTWIEHILILISVNLDTIVHATTGSTVIVEEPHVTLFSRLRSIWWGGNKGVKSLLKSMVINGKSELAMFRIFFILWDNWASWHQGIGKRLTLTCKIGHQSTSSFHGPLQIIQDLFLKHL